MSSPNGATHFTMKLPKLERICKKCGTNQIYINAIRCDDDDCNGVILTVDKVAKLAILDYLHSTVHCKQSGMALIQGSPFEWESITQKACLDCNNCKIWIDTFDYNQTCVAIAIRYFKKELKDGSVNIYRLLRTVQDWFNWQDHEDLEFHELLEEVSMIIKRIS